MITAMTLDDEAVGIIFELACRRALLASLSMQVSRPRPGGRRYLRAAA